jgi:mono-ADP-ribosyltransferase sirtuin 6
MKTLERKIETLAQWMYGSQYLVVFTGAGISTESGLSDFRGPDGVWTRRDRGLEPITPAVSLEAAEPNADHNSIVEIQKLGKLKLVIFSSPLAQASW